jgi:hypothetical protein
MIVHAWQRMDPRLLAVIASLLISLYTLLLPELPNDDAYTYMRTAELYLQDGINAAFNHYSWVTYPVLLAETSRLGLSLMQAGYLLNTAFFALLVFSYVSLIAELNSKRLVVMLGGLTVLLYPELNEFRYFLIRDVAYWSLAITGIWQLLCYCRSGNLQHGLFFALSFILAALFRAEAIAHLALLPMAALFPVKDSLEDHKRRFLRLGAISYGALIAGALLLLLAGFNFAQALRDYFSVYQPFVQSTFNPDPLYSTELGRLLFGEYAAMFSEEYLSGVIIIGLLFILVMALFKGISGTYFWMLLYGGWKDLIEYKQLRQGPLLLTMLLNLLIIVGFLYLTRFLTSRYTILLCLILVTQVPVIIACLIERLRQSRWRQSGYAFLILFYLYCLFDAYTSFGKPRDYLVEAANIVAEQTAADAAVFTNNRSIAFFSERVAAYDEVQRIPSGDALMATRPGDWIALELIPEVRSLLTRRDIEAALVLHRTLPESDEPRVAIYRRVAP